MASSAPDSDAPIAAQRLADAFGVSSRQARDVLDGLGATKVKGRGYQLGSVLRVLYRRRVDQDSASATLASQDARLKSAQADLREFELAQRSGEYSHVRTTGEVLQRVVVALTNRVDALAARLSSDLVMVDQGRAHRVLSAESREIREQIYRDLGELVRFVEAKAGERDS